MTQKLEKPRNDDAANKPAAKPAPLSTTTPTKGFKAGSLPGKKQ